MNGSRAPTSHLFTKDCFSYSHWISTQHRKNIQRLTREEISRRSHSNLCGGDTHSRGMCLKRSKGPWIRARSSRAQRSAPATGGTFLCRGGNPGRAQGTAFHEHCHPPDTHGNSAPQNRPGFQASSPKSNLCHTTSVWDLQGALCLWVWNKGSEEEPGTSWKQS